VATRDGRRCSDEFYGLMNRKKKMEGDDDEMMTMGFAGI